MLGRQGGGLQKYERQHGKHQGLDNADKDFEEEKREWQEVGNQVEHHDKEHFASENVTEETKGKRNDLSEFTHQFQNAYQRSDEVGFAKRIDKEFARVLAQAESSDADSLNNDDRHERERKRKIKVGRRAAQEGNDSRVAIYLVPQADSTEARQKLDPINAEHEEENSRNERERIGVPAYGSR